MTSTVLNVLPHPGGGAETFIDCLEPLDGFTQLRRPLSPTRRALLAGPPIAMRWPALARAARAADIVQTHGDVASMLTLPLHARGPSVAVMQGLHFLRRARGPRRKLAEACLRRVAAAATRVVVSSQAEAQELLEMGVEERVLALVPNTIPDRPPPSNEDRRRARRELGLPADGTVALYLGQLEQRKDPLTAVAAAERVRGLGLPLELLVAGEGPLLPSVRARQGHGVHVLGHRCDVDRLLAAADVFVAPSRREGLSFAVLEAMHAGHALVVSDGPGNPEAVGEAGLVVPVGDADAFTEALASLVSDDELRRRHSQAARGRFAREFEQRHFLERMSALYSEVLAEDG